MKLSKMGGKHTARKRQRGSQGPQPFAWRVLGEGGDFDQVGAGGGLEEGGLRVLQVQDSACFVDGSPSAAVAA